MQTNNNLYYIFVFIDGIIIAVHWLYCFYNIINNIDCIVVFIIVM